MPSYCGTELQQRLQRRAEEVLGRASTTPGFCNGGRLVAVDDAERVGWAAVLAELERDGALALRMLPSERVPDATRLVVDAGFRIDFHETFTADIEAALQLSEEIIGRGPPPGFRHEPFPARGDHPFVAQVQEFMLANGIAPFAGSLLAGEHNMARTFVLTDATGLIAATAHTYLPHNASSRFHQYAWAGLVAVAPEMRGKSLGRYINACAVAAAFTDLGASTVYELVHETNEASRRMVESCGLRLDPLHKTGAATTGPDRFTR
jgi:RimJ/RimL family protein N-acetyltransferase